VKIGKRCIIYPWCLIFEGASIGDSVEVHERCTIGSLTVVGSQSIILYGAQVHDNIRIGKKCIIAGFVADNTIVGDGCSVFGALVHQYKSPGRGRWDNTNEIGPTLGKNVVVAWGAVIAGPVRIGNGAWIAPNSVVTTDVPAGARYVCR
jgi:serine O-acetyltransferase